MKKSAKKWGMILLLVAIGAVVEYTIHPLQRVFNR